IREPWELISRPSHARHTPDMSFSSLYLPFSANSSLGGITPASEFLSDLTSSMNRIVSVSLGSGLRGTLLPVCRTREAGSTRPVCLLGGPGASSCRNHRLHATSRWETSTRGFPEKGLPGLKGDGTRCSGRS